MELLDIDGVAELLKISRMSVRRLVLTNQIAHRRILGRRLIRFTWQDVQEYLDRARRSPAAVA